MAKKEQIGDDAYGVPLTLHEIRALLSSQARGLSSKEITPANANAVANVVGKILSSVKLEMEYARLTNRQSRIDLLEPGSGSEDR